jgi:carotenoid 1,2-hydratase
MQLLSDITRDGRHQKTEPGSFEWWYFDGISEDGEYQIVVVFYDGCPFSAEYVRSLDKTGQALPEGFPAISISVYHRGNPIFNSFSHYPADNCTFGDGVAAVNIGDNSFRFAERENHGVREFASFDLRINEQLPSGQELKGIITFIGLNPCEYLLSNGKESNTFSDSWNLAMPLGQLQCRMNLIKDGLIKEELKFDGSGYHDHFLGYKPMKNRIHDWYWGRAHFPQATLVYSVMNLSDGDQTALAWLVSPDNRRLLHDLQPAAMKSHRLNKYFMRPARRLDFQNNDIEVSILHQKVIDSGPWYSRYISRVSLEQPSLGITTVRGIGEYTRPRRLNRRFLWPFIQKRIRLVDR